jgi:hypothetical protein
LKSAVEAPNLDRVDLKSGIIVLPCGIPLALGIIERVDRVGILIAPGLATNTIWEVSVCASDCEIEDQEEFSVEGSGIVLSYPGIGEIGREFSSLEKALLRKINLKDLVGIRIDISIELVLVPIESIDVEVFTE